MLVAEVTAVNDLWIIGDKFVNDNYHALSKMKTEANIARRPGPYIFDYFHVSCFTPNPQSLVKDVLARFVNCLIKALNDATKLPRIIIIIPDDDILCFINFVTYGIKQVCRSAISYVSTQMTRALETKKEQLIRRKPGSIIASEPKLIWVNMMDKIDVDDEVLALRSKYNSALI